MAGAGGHLCAGLFAPAGNGMTTSPSSGLRPRRAGRALLLGGLAMASAPASAAWASTAGVQSTGVPSGSPTGSLVVDPQQGATPRPLTVPPSLPAQPLSTPSLPTPSSPAAPLLSGPVPRSAPPAVQVPSSLRPSAAQPGGLQSLPRRGVEGGLPVPAADPLRIDPATDPVLRLARGSTEPAAFRAAIAEAVRRNPALGEAVAQVDEADAARDEARARALPTVDASVSTFRVLTRAFSNDPGNVLERSRPRRRTDGLLRVQQPLVDFGASRNRIRAGDARLEAARAGVDDSGTRVALAAVSAWYQVYGLRALVRLAGAFAASQRDLRTALQDRVRQGAAAPADIAQVDGYIASADAQVADFRRQQVTAEAQYEAVIGAVPSADLGRAPPPSLDGIARGTLDDDTERLPAVRAARSGAEAARLDARAVRADQLPQLTAGIDAGRYGIIETDRDYDIRGNLTLSMRLGGGAAQRARQAVARAEGADARLRRTRIDALRDAEIALADVAALEEAEAAIRANYLAGRQSRDVLAERFRVSRGTLFDLLGAESNYFGVAARYLQTVIELDSARYALLARTGRLLPALGLDAATLEPR